MKISKIEMFCYLMGVIQFIFSIVRADTLREGTHISLGLFFLLIGHLIRIENKVDKLLLANYGKNKLNKGE